MSPIKKHIDTKIHLHGVIIITLLAVAYSVVSFSNTYSNSIQPSSFRSFSTSAEGKVVSIPDVAQFTFSVITEGGKDIAKLQKENTQKANLIIDLAKIEGIEDKDIKTQSYNLSPRYQYYSCERPVKGEAEPCPPAEIVGYTVSQSVLLKIRDFEKIGEMLSGAVQSGANSVSELAFTIDDMTEVQNQAREEAIKKAKIKAKAIASAAGFRLGRVLSINEDRPSPYYKTTFAAVAEMDALGGGAPAIEAGSQEVTVNITITYEIR
jgi:hypothetical protein